MTINTMNIMKLGLSQNLMIFEGSLVIILEPYFNVNSAHYIHLSATRKIPKNKQFTPY
jgi:hypothetical protein